MRAAPYLTKSSFIRGLSCHRMLWLSWHNPPPRQTPEPGSPVAIGTEIGEKAQLLFPGGVLVDQPPWQHQEAVDRTRQLMSDPDVPAIFEAAFEYEGVRLRADVLERLQEGHWRLCEVKSSSKVKAKHIDDAAVQVWVLQQCGLTVESVELIHIDTTYIYEGGEIDWPSFFKRKPIGDKVASALPEIEAATREHLEILAQASEPAIEPGPHCPADCDFWAHCTKNKPQNWIYQLPRLSAKKYAALQDLGIDRIRDIPEAFDLTDLQDRVRDVIVKGRPYVSDRLPAALTQLEGPLAYLDFEAMMPAAPIYPSTRPYQRLPFQWSLHLDDGAGSLTHADFLADPSADPRESFANALVSTLAGGSEPIVVYSAYERSVLSELADTFPSYGAALEEIMARFTDLYAIVRDHVYLESFGGSLSIKSVGKALAPGFSYDGLELVANGADAASAFQQLALGSVTNSDAEALRAALRSYCRLDTLAMYEAHQGLRHLALSTN